MNWWNVIVIALPGAPTSAEDVCTALRTAGAPASLRLEPIAADAMDDLDRLEALDAVILIDGVTMSEAQLLDVLSYLEERATPVLALVPGSMREPNPYALTGAMTVPLTTSPVSIVGMLQALLHRQREVLRLRDELALGLRFQGGLRGEMTRLHDELQLAAIVQRQLLPNDMPSVRGVHFAALWRPVNYVSGDIYDVIPLDEDHVGLFLADAVGHGVPAALMTMILCQSLKPFEGSRAGPRIRTPSRVLALLNDAMIQRQAGPARFATAVYGVLDCRSRVLTLAGAGHPPPIRLSSDGRCTDLETPGGLLGVFPDETFDQIEVELGLDDRLLLFSDGFEQAFPAPTPAAGGSNEYSQRVPTTRYRAEFEELIRQGSAEAMIRQVSQRLDVQRGSLHQVDDLTLLCIHAGSIADAHTPALTAPAISATPGTPVTPAPAPAPTAVALR